MESPATKWITNEVDKKLLKEGVTIAGTKKLSIEECERLVAASPLQVLQRVEEVERQPAPGNGSFKSAASQFLGALGSNAGPGSLGPARPSLGARRRKRAALL
jgi:hypothetical protein